MHGAQRLSVLTESQTLALTKRVRELKKEGKDVLGLTLGEPDFDTPNHIREAAIRAIREGFTHYPPVAGIPELREAIAAKFKRDNGLPVQASGVVVSTGAKQSLINAIMSLVNPGDEVIIPAPFWVSYSEMLKMADAVPVIIQTSQASNFSLTPEALEAHITPKTRMLILNSPSNPAGNMYSRATMDGIAEVLKRYPHIFILADEIYEYISFGTKHISIGADPELFDRTITVNGFSKGYAMTGWRCGYIGAPKWIADLCEKFQGQVTSGTCSISQRAAVAALEGPMDSVWAMRDAFRQRRDTMYERLKKMPGLELNMPDGAFYFYPNVKGLFGATTPAGKLITTGDDVAAYLLDEAMLAVIPGSSFGTDPFIRISYAYAQQELDRAMERMGNAIHALSMP